MLDPTPASRQIVTSSDLVRHFGYWQDRAARTPVYILHRGRPRLVLTSVEIMDALCAPHFAGQGCGPDLAAVLERVADRVLIANDRQQIIAVSETARRDFGVAAEIGRAVVRIVPDAAQAQLATAIDRVARTGLAMSLDVPGRTAAAGPMTLMVDGWPAGVMLVARDTTDGIDTAERAALDEAITVSAAIAPVRIDLRGRLEAGSSALAGWCNLRADSLAAVPFASLFDGASQGKIRDAVDRVIRTGQALSLDALLLANLAVPIALRIGFAARRSGDAVSGIAAVLVAPGGLDRLNPV